MAKQKDKKKRVEEAAAAGGGTVSEGKVTWNKPVEVGGINVVKDISPKELSQEEYMQLENLRKMVRTPTSEELTAWKINPNVRTVWEKENAANELRRAEERLRGEEAKNYYENIAIINQMEKEGIPRETITQEMIDAELAKIPSFNPENVEMFGSKEKSIKNNPLMAISPAFNVPNFKNFDVTQFFGEASDIITKSFVGQLVEQLMGGGGGGSSSRETVAIQAGIEGMSKASDLLTNDIKFVEQGVPGTSTMAIQHMQQLKQAITNMENATHGYSKLSNSYFVNKGADWETQLNNYKQVLEDFAIKLQIADRQAQLSKGRASFGVPKND